MIKTIIFDLGGVVVPERIRTIRKAIANELGLENLDLIPEELKNQATKGQIRLIDLYTEIIKKINKQITPESLLEKHLAIYKEEATEIDNEMMALVNSLKQGYCVPCLTNTEVEIAEFNRERGLFDYFDKAYISTEMNARKPDPEIYHKVLEDLSLLPEEAVFIDNKLEYVEGARNVGINGILFEGIEKLREDLKEIGINF